MSIGVVARKCGMTRIFDPSEGVSIPVTVLEVKPNRITQLKTLESDGYYAVQVTMGEQNPSRITKPAAGHFAKANSVPGLGLWEFRTSEKESEPLTVGGEITVSMFKEGQIVDVSGITKGRGFSGVIRRHNFSSQRASHGN